MSAYHRIPDVRPLTEQEKHLLERLLRHGPLAASAFLRQLPGVSVVSRCGCGCPTIDLAVEGQAASPGSPTTILAEGGGLSPQGVHFGLIVHGREGLISELEVYPIDSEEPFTLPSVEDIEIYGQT